MSEENGQGLRETIWQMETRESFTLCLQDRARLEVLQDRLAGLYRWGTRSDMVRAGLWLLTGLDDQELEQLFQSVGGSLEAKQAV